jgi:hypothetical protein
MGSVIPIEERADRPRHRFDPDKARVGVDTFAESQPAPEMIVDGLLPNDVCGIFAAGGMGKTTLMLNVADSIVRGGSCFGFTVNRPGNVLIITAEDDLVRYKHRLYRLGWDLGLDHGARDRLGAGLFIEDCTDVSVRLVEQDARGNLVETGFADEIISAYEHLKLSLMILDPMVSFGPGERFVNDGAAAVIIAARRIRRALNCPVLFVGHTGKANGRAASEDQYATRDASALVDGMRAVYVMTKAGGAALPPGIDAQAIAESRVYRLAVPKLSDAAQWVEPLYLVRSGHRFDAVATTHQTKDERRAANVDVLVAFLRKELEQGRRHTKSSLADVLEHLGLSRAAMRAAVDDATEAKCVAVTDLPPDAKRQGAKKDYLRPIP